MKQKISFFRIYLKYTSLVMLIIGVVFTLQVIFVHKQFQPIYLIAPVTLSLVIGFLLSAITYMRRHLNKKSRLMHALVEMAPELSCIEDTQHNYTYVSNAALHITGYTPDAFYADPHLLESLILDIDRPKWNAFRSEIAKHDESHYIELRIQTKSGALKWIEYYCSAIYDDEHNITAYRSTSLNISKRKGYELEIQHLAEYDPLTELPNRRYMHELITNLIATSKQEKRSFAVLFVDLDRFKHINDTHGHSLGDKLLHELAVRLNTDKPFDYFISRFGGDEFVVVIPVVNDMTEVRRKAEMLLECINSEFVISSIPLHIDATIGIACFPEHGENVESLIKNADTAMYHAKQNTIYNIGFFQKTLSENSWQFLHIEHELRQAIKTESITLHYQPQFNIRTMEISGAESLARWMDASGNTVMSPLQFIPVAEETGLIIPLGEYLLDSAVEQLSRWQRKGIAIKISLNVSAAQFSSDEFCDVMLKKLSQEAINPENFEIEITESVLVKNTQAQLDLIERIKSKDISIAIDDFGTGYSSISYLRNLSSNVLKIDKKFIDVLEHSQSDRNLVHAIITLAHNFNMLVVAEGIETQEQLEILRELDCDHGQGFLFAEPMPAEEFEAFYTAAKSTLEESTLQ